MATWLSQHSADLTHHFAYLGGCSHHIGIATGLLAILVDILLGLVHQTLHILNLSIHLVIFEVITEYNPFIGIFLTAFHGLSELPHELIPGLLSGQLITVNSHIFVEAKIHHLFGGLDTLGFDCTDGSQDAPEVIHGVALGIIFLSHHHTLQTAFNHLISQTSNVLWILPHDITKGIFIHTSHTLLTKLGTSYDVELTHESWV